MNTLLGRWSAPLLREFGCREQKDRWLHRCAPTNGVGGGPGEPPLRVGADCVRACWDGDLWELSGLRPQSLPSNMVAMVLARTDLRVSLEEGLSLFVIDGSSRAAMTARGPDATLAVDDFHRLGDIGGGWRMCVRVMGREGLGLIAAH